MPAKLEGEIFSSTRQQKACWEKSCDQSTGRFGHRSIRIKSDCRELYVGREEMGFRKPRNFSCHISWFNLYRLGELDRLGHGGQRRKVHLLSPDRVNFTDCEADQSHQAICTAMLINACRFPTPLREDHLVKKISSFQFFKMTWLDKPVADRSIYKLIKRREIRSIVEVGLGDGSRCEKLIAVAQKFTEEKVRYTGVDLFDARQSSTPLKLIEMHRRLKGVDAKTQLVPGDIGSALPRIANSHLRTDLILISSGFDRDQFSEVKSFLPRMLHASSIVLLQTKEEAEFKKLSRLEIENSIKNPMKKRKAA